MGKYVKRPVIIEALKWYGSDAGATGIIVWLESQGGTAELVREGQAHPLRRQDEKVTDLAWADPKKDAPAFLAVTTVDAVGRVDSGDWVIQGVEDEFYPCKGYIFAKTYDAVPNEDSDGTWTTTTIVAPDPLGPFGRGVIL